MQHPFLHLFPQYPGFVQYHGNPHQSDDDPDAVCHGNHNPSRRNYLWPVTTTLPTPLPTVVPAYNLTTGVSGNQFPQLIAVRRRFPRMLPPAVQNTTLTGQVNWRLLQDLAETGMVLLLPIRRAPVCLRRSDRAV